MNIEKMREAGAKLANIAYNLAQRYTQLPAATLVALKDAQVEWDAALREESAAPANFEQALVAFYDGTHKQPRTAALHFWEAAITQRAASEKAAPAPSLLTRPCRQCAGTRKSCTMNCGPAVGEKRTRAQVLSTCDDCDSCCCRWNRIGPLQSAAIRATEKLPAGYRLSIELIRDSGTVSIVGPKGITKVIEGEGYLSDDVTEAIDMALVSANGFAL